MKDNSKNLLGEFIVEEKELLTHNRIVSGNYATGAITRPYNNAMLGTALRNPEQTMPYNLANRMQPGILDTLPVGVLDALRDRVSKELNKQ